MPFIVLVKTNLHAVQKKNVTWKQSVAVLCLLKDDSAEGSLTQLWELIAVIP